MIKIVFFKYFSDDGRDIKNIKLKFFLFFYSLFKSLTRSRWKKCQLSNVNWNKIASPCILFWCICCRQLDPRTSLFTSAGRLQFCSLFLLLWPFCYISISERFSTTAVRPSNFHFASKMFFFATIEGRSNCPHFKNGLFF